MATSRLKAVITDKNFLTGVGVIILGLFMYFASFDIQEFIRTRVGASFVPRVASSLFVILGGILILGSFRCTVPTETPEYATEEEEEEEGEKVFGGLPAVFLSLILMIAYVGLMESVGFIITSVVYIFLQILVLAKQGPHNYLVFGLISIVVPIVVFYLFVNVFKVLIPAGILG